MSSPVLVTGAAGFAGSHLLELLDRASPPVDIVAWHRPDDVAPLEPGATTAARMRARESSLRWEAVNILDANAVRAAIAGARPALVFHCAGAAHVANSWGTTEATFAVNVRGTHYLLDALRRERLEARVLIPSSALVYAPSGSALSENHPLVPGSPYGFSKLAQELLGVRSIDDGLHVTIARAFNHIGPRQDPLFATSSFARQIAEIEAHRREPEIVVGNLDARRDMTDVRDTVRAYTVILERGKPGRPYNVCSGRAIAVREVLDLMVSRARVPVRVRIDPARYRPNDLPTVLGDPGRIQDEMGWTPRIPLEQTVDDLLEYWRSQCESS
jgi:GDP-4-dehydro-6-deoxy-D-mannose reductase